jgi:hypothetical protein
VPAPSFRVEPQSERPSYSGGDEDCGFEVCRELVVSGCDAAPVFQPAEHLFDRVAQPVGLAIKGVGSLTGWVVRDDGAGTARDQEEAECVAVVGGVSGAQAGWWERFDENPRDRRVAALARGYAQREGTAAAIDNSMDFCRSPAARAADRRVVGPPFPPAAERCALAVVLSIIWTPSASAATSAATACARYRAPPSD